MAAMRRIFVRPAARLRRPQKRNQRLKAGRNRLPRGRKTKTRLQRLRRPRRPRQPPLQRLPRLRHKDKFMAETLAPITPAAPAAAPASMAPPDVASAPPSADLSALTQPGPQPSAGGSQEGQVLQGAISGENQAL